MEYEQGIFSFKEEDPLLVVVEPSTKCQKIEDNKASISHNVDNLTQKDLFVPIVNETKVVENPEV